MSCMLNSSLRAVCQQLKGRRWRAQAICARRTLLLSSFRRIVHIVVAAVVAAAGHIGIAPRPG